ncbi:MFS transporter [Xylogone sp. PMI_703]|nr:MFS transporter [Xylogone sp. PMI_703]
MSVRSSVSDPLDKEDELAQSSQPIGGASDRAINDDIPGNTPYDQRDVEREAGLDEGSETTKALHGMNTIDGNTKPNSVDWDGPNDPANPQNWRGSEKYSIVVAVSLMCLITPLASSMFAPGVPLLMEEFHSTSIELSSFVVSVYVLGFAIGPLFLSPLSEMYGRLPLYHMSNILFLVFTVACAKSSTLNMLIGFRFLAGCVGSIPLTIGGGTIADLIVQEKRGSSMAIFSLGPLLGPVIGPIAGGYLSQAKGWRWVFWVLTMVGGAVTILTFILMHETYPVVLLQRKTERLRRETGNQDLRSKYDQGLSRREIFKHSIIRPIKMLARSPIVLFMSLFVGVCYGYLYLLFTTFTTVFEGVYKFSSGTVGLTYVGLGVGSLIGVAIFAVASDRILRLKSAKGEMKPEYRLPPMIPGGFLIPIGLFWYGWSAQAHTHWIVPILGTMVIGIGNLGVFMSIQTYLVDAFPIYAASALSANAVIRSVLGAVLPLAGNQMYESLGFGWGNSLLAFIAIALLPIPFVFYLYGERIRTWYPLKL